MEPSSHSFRLFQFIHSLSNYSFIPFSRRFLLIWIIHAHYQHPQQLIPLQYSFDSHCAFHHLFVYLLYLWTGFHKDCDRLLLSFVFHLIHIKFCAIFHVYYNQINHQKHHLNCLLIIHSTQMKIKSHRLIYAFHPFIYILIHSFNIYNIPTSQHTLHQSTKIER